MLNEHNQEKEVVTVSGKCGESISIMVDGKAVFLTQQAAKKQAKCRKNLRKKAANSNGPVAEDWKQTVSESKQEVGGSN